MLSKSLKNPSLLNVQVRIGWELPSINILVEGSVSFVAGGYERSLSRMRREPFLGQRDEYNDSLDCFILDLSLRGAYVLLPLLISAPS